jgi:hypothetical protein
MSPTSGLVDVIVAVHQVERPVERAVRSVLRGAPEGARVTVVCHGLPSSAFEQRFADVTSSQVRLIEHVDGIASPAGPFNAGLDSAQAKYVAVMGSDDLLAEGALPAWVARAEATGANAVLARVEHQGGGLVRTPPTRWGRRTSRLRLAQDRLAYRTAPLGLLRRSLLEEQGLRFTPGLSTGEDLAFGLRLWANGEGLHYAAADPAYIVGSDAQVRVTMSRRPISADLECCLRVVDAPWFATLAPRDRTAVVVKLVRIHVFGAIYNRRELPSWTVQDRQDLSSAASAMLTAAPAASRALSLVERQLLSAGLDVASPESELTELSARRVRHGRWNTVATPDLRGLLSAQGPLRLMASSALMR